MPSPSHLRLGARVALAAITTASVLSLSGCGLIGAAIALAPLKLMFACLPEGTQIDLPGGTAQPIETLKTGDLVIGFEGKPVKILQIHGYLEDADETDFHAITFSNGSTVNLCSMHRIDGVRAKTLTPGHTISSGLSVTENRIYRGVERSYDILTEDAGYRIGSIPVNSMIEEMHATGRSGQVRE